MSTIKIKLTTIHFLNHPVAILSICCNAMNIIIKYFTLAYHFFICCLQLFPPYMPLLRQRSICRSPQLRLCYSFIRDITLFFQRALEHADLHTFYNKINKCLDLIFCRYKLFIHLILFNCLSNYVNTQQKRNIYRSLIYYIQYYL